MVKRMKARCDYVRLNRLGKRFFYKAFIAQVVPKKNPEGLLGITATKKLGCAVKRNRAKRRLREVIRLWNKKNEKMLTFDIVLIARREIFGIHFKNLQQDWLNMLVNASEKD